MKHNKWTLGLAAAGVISLQNVIKAHAATGEVGMSEHISKMHHACQKAVCGDARFCTPKDTSPNAYKPTPYVVDITTPDSKGQMHAIIQTAKGELVRHGFDFNKDEGTAKLVEGDSKPTESTRVYASAIERHENMIKATQETISCRATVGSKLDLSEAWVSGKSVSYIFVPAGISTISAGFRSKESITCTIEVDEQTAKDLQESFDFIAATDKQEPYADEDHEAKKATLRFPTDKVNFVYGTLRGEEGVIVKGAEPTSYGAESVNGKVYRSWSPEFGTDANYAKAKCKKGHWTFPDGVRGSASNPARIVAVNFVTGALTNKPAFKNMPPVKAKQELPEPETESRFVKAAKESDSITLNDLQNSVCEAAKADDRFKTEKASEGFCIWCCDLILSGDNEWKAIVQAKGKLFEVGFTIDDEDKCKVTLSAESKEVTRKTEYISACDKQEFLLNGEVIKAAGNSEGVKKSWESRKAGMPTAPLMNDFTPSISHGAFGHTAMAHLWEEHPHTNEAVQHRTAAQAHEHAELSHTASSKDYKVGSTPHTYHKVMAEHHNSQRKFHQSESKLGTAQAADATPSPLEAIYARHEAEQKAAEAIGMKSPEIAAREAEKNKPVDTSLDSIYARKKAERDFEDSLIERNPLLANRETIEKLATQKT